MPLPPSSRPVLLGLPLLGPHIAASRRRSVLILVIVLILAYLAFSRLSPPAPSSSFPDLATSAMEPGLLRDKPGNAVSVRATSAGSGRSSSAKVNQYSIWAMPEEGSAFHTSASAAISNLSSRYHCTPFEPHVTVIGAFGEREGLEDEEVVRRMERLSAVVKPYDIEVMELASGRLFFQCVYLKMRPSPQVLHVHKQAVEVMGMSEEAIPAYMPHLSLIYGDLSDDQKQEAKEAVGDAFSSLLPPANSTSASPSPSFHVSSLALYRTEPTDLSMSTWERLGVFPLTGRD